MSSPDDGAVRTVQATVSATGPSPEATAVLQDDGRRLVVPASALAGSGYRHLRIGQRVRVDLDREGQVVALRWPNGSPSQPRS